MDILDIILIGLITLIVIGIIVTIIFFVTMQRTYKINFILWKIANERVIRYATKAKEFEKNGVIGYKLLKHYKHIAPLADPDAIEIDNKGKQCMEAYWNGDELTYIKQDISTKEIGSKNPITSADRVTMHHQIKKRIEETRNAQHWLREHLPTIAFATVIIAVLIIGFLFFESWNDYRINTQDFQASITQKQLEITGMLKETIERSVAIQNEETNQNKPKPATPPN